ncbi:MAG TPA: alpha/beta fold hydrolase [Gaiellaceae bacterium]|nr:alpha/beta fold hydrolase [Gaiellaceae bacterium]
MTDSFAQSGEIRIAYEEHGEGEPLLLIHGLGYGRWGWGPVVAPLAGRLRVVLLDNRGIGASDAPPGPYSVAQMAEDAAAVLDRAGIERANVVGTSLGGMVAQQLVVAHPHRVDRLVLACTTPGGERAFPFPRGTLRLLEQTQQLEPLVALRRFVENALAPGAPEALVDEIAALRVANLPDPVGWAAQAAAAAAFDGFDRLGEIAAPTLVLHGTADEVVDPRNAGLLAERIPDARAELLEGAGHLFFWEQPHEFVRYVMEFLA